MKYVYVLTSSEKDFYYEQFFLSITSLRMYNPDAEVVVLIDEKTKGTLTGKRSGYEKLGADAKIIPVPDTFTQKEASRYIKTSIHNHIDDDFLFIDCDTVIADTLECAFANDIQVGAVLDNHTVIQRHRVKNEIIEDNLRLGFDSIKEQTHYYNGGLIFCRNTGAHGRAFFEKWHELWLRCRAKGNSQDMPALNRANTELNGVIQELGGEWNCQIAFGGLPFLHNAKIMHYYASELNFYTSPYAFSADGVALEIRQTGVIPAGIMELLRSPLAAFEPDARIISDKNQLEVLNSSLFAKLMWLKKRHNSFFTALDSFTAGATKTVKKLTRYRQKK